MKSRSENSKSILHSLRVLFVALAVAITAASCTKQKELKDDVGSDRAKATDKALFSSGSSLVGGAEFSLSRGIEDALFNKDNPYTAGAIPGFSTDYGIVRAEITENSLRFIQDQGVNNRSETADVVMSFPIKEHFDILRDKNDYGDETNKIVKDTKKPWNERQYMIVDWANPSNPAGQLNVQVAGDLTAVQTDAVLVEPLKVSDKDINFATEVSIYNTRVLTRTHLTKLEKSDFKPVIYNRDDFHRFGLFLTEHKNLNSNGETKDADDIHYAEMFNVCEAGRAESCSTNKIVWHLSKGFPDRYLEKTRQVVKEWNQAFQEALGRSDDVVVLEEKQVDISDPTSNVIAYYEPEAGGGLLGVAQGTVDWRTGQKLSARATVYEAGIRYTLGGIDTLIDLLRDDKSTLDTLKEEGKETANQKLAKTGKELNVLDVARKSRVAGMTVVGSAGLKTAASMDAVLNKNLDSVRKFLGKSNALENAAVANPAFATLTARDTDLLKNFIKNPDDLKKETLESFQRIITMGAANRANRDQVAKKMSSAAMSSEAAGIHGSEVVEEAAIRYIQKLLKDGMTVEALDANRSAIKENIAQLTFYTTLLHEMGHTFGLRHNFAGTADEKNFMPEYFQVKAKLASHDTSVKTTDLDPHMYSSIMDYHADFYSGEAGLGPYDKAAIKYAYNRGLDKNSFALDSNGKQKFMFCTDDDLGESVTCRQFDKGTTVAEITQNQIDRLKRGYITSHFRRGRAAFLSSLDDYRALEGRLFMQYVHVRQAIDEFVYQMIVQGVDASGCRNFIKKSVENNEMFNLCDPAEAQKIGLQSMDIRELARALKPLPEGKKYVANGFADLVLAGKEAMQFFVDTLGAPEPAIYIPSRDTDGTLVMKPVVALNEHVSDAQIEAVKQQILRQFAQNAGAKTEEEIQAFIQKNYGLVVALKPGQRAKFLYGQEKRDGFGVETDVVPFMIDKEIALAALSTRDLGVTKYSEAQVNMQGNAYLWFHTADWTHEIFEAVMKGTGKIATVEVPAPGQADQKLSIGVPASLDRNLQIQSMALGMTEFTSFDDTAFANRIKFYRGNDPAMAGITGLEKASFTGADGTLYTAFQTPDSKSIAYNIAKAAADAASAAQELQAIATNPVSAEAAVEKKVTSEGEAARAKAEAAFNNNQDMIPYAKALFSKDATSLWSRAKANLAKSVDAKADQNAVQAENAALMQLAQQADQQVGQAVGQHLKTTQDLNCWNQISNNGSPAGLGAECRVAIAVFNVSTYYSKAMNVVLQALNFVDETKDTASRLQNAQSDLAQAQDNASVLSNLQHLLGLQ